MMRLRFALPLLLAVLIMTACGDDPVTPISPTPTPIVTETFSGTINKNGAATHNFTITGAGDVTGTLTALSVGTDVAVSFSLGSWNGSTCTIVIANDRALQGAIIIGQANSLGTLCVRISDVGNIVDTTDYEISIAHH